MEILAVSEDFGANAKPLRSGYSFLEISLFSWEKTGKETVEVLKRFL